ncbi:sigma-70 family RNA polymerase sigma factor [Oceanicola sp. 22II-s10i]|uniref:sigma-70 family RNA polymerase sigma factor n=1 Tax=Oceanicola sp. 22II-s10i TaxID=1317116 RepID=UPI0020CBEB34|nr:sigma-70 family RNA polymerase sigma factor [Oceanicola sp. 22II-s10i]
MREPLLEADQERAAICSWQDHGDRKALELLLRSHARQAWSQAARFTDNPVHMEDLASEGFIGLMRAADNFDRAQEVRFSTYAGWWVMNGVSSALARTKTVIDVPSRTYLDAHLGKLDEDERQRVRMAVQGCIAIDYAPDEEDNPRGRDILISDDAGPEDIVTEDSRHRQISGLIGSALARMSKEESEVIRRRKLQPAPDSYEEIAFDLRVTPERLRQVEKRALMRLRRILIDCGFSRSVLA